VAYIGAGVLFLLALAGLIHAMVTPKNEAFAAVDPTDSRSPAAV
jgi:hypothetical protein